MTRRNVLAGAAASAFSGLGANVAEGPGNNVFLDLKRYQLHNSPEKQAERLTTFLESSYSPAIGRAGGKLIGAFNNLIGMEAPYLLTLTQYDSLAAMQTALAKLASDSEYQRAVQSLDSSSGYPFVRQESSLLKTFDGMPQPLLSPSSDVHPPRYFELRRYESQTEATLVRKVKMFNSGEIGIFQRLGMRPVFFGETLVGERMPNLYYMLSFDSWEAREELWKKFGSDPEWAKLRSPDELHDDQIVSNISNALLRPLKFSLIR
jgi:hypothetical protein